MTLEKFPASPNESVSALGFDFGTQRIGVAYGQSISASAKPVAVLKAKDGIPDWEDIARLLKQWQPSVCVVGMPYNMDGSDSELLVRAVKFGLRLHGRFGLPVFGMDERLSSTAARDKMMEQKYRSRDAVIDDVAAQIILQNWLEELTSRKSSI